MDAESDRPEVREDDRRLGALRGLHTAVDQPLGRRPAITSCAIPRTPCTEFTRNKTWELWYPIAERFDDEGESGATLKRPGLAKLLQRIE